MASNKKWIIGGSITLLVVLGLSMGTGAIIGAVNKPDLNYIKVHLGNEVYDAQIDLGTDSTSDEEKARLLENQFYSAALYGSYAGAFAEADADLAGSYIFNTTDEDLKWNLPFIVSDSASAVELQNSFIKVKFLSDTEDSSVWTFLSSMKDTTDNKELLLQATAALMADAETVGIPYPAVTGLDVVNNDAFSTSRDLIYELLVTDTTYVKEVQKDMMVFAYLWQDSPQSAYDYIFTRELVYSSPSIVYSMTIDGEKADTDGGATYAALASQETNAVTASQWNGYITEFKTNDILVDDSIDGNYLGSVSNMQGYDGIKFGTSAGSTVASDWTEWDNTWVPSEGEINTSETEQGDYSHTDVLSTANFYLADSENGADGEGAVIFDTSSSSTDPEFGNRVGERTIYAYSQLYPYVFREVEKPGASDEEDVFGNESFALFANEAAGVYSPIEEGTEASATYIFDEWFGELSVEGEIYVAESLISYNTSLTSKALKFWNEKGFYIELSGSYEDDLASYLPEEILDDN